MSFQPDLVNKPGAALSKLDFIDERLVSTKRKMTRTVYVLTTGLAYEGSCNILGVYSSLQKAIENGNRYHNSTDSLSEEKLWLNVEASMVNEEYYVYIEKMEIDKDIPEKDWSF